MQNLRPLLFFLLCLLIVPLLPAQTAEEGTFTSIKEALAHPLKVKILDLSEKKLSQIPSEIGSFTNLEILILDDNKLKSIPSGIYKLPKLRELQLAGNQLSKISKKVAKIKTLEFLDLSDNPLQEAFGDWLRDNLPEEIELSL